jgi:hypothetical protein
MTVSPAQFASAGLAAMLAACSPGSGSTPPATSVVAISPIHARQAAAVRIQATCPVAGGTRATTSDERRLSPSLAPVLAAALVPIAVDFAVSAVRDYLARVESERTASYTASGAGSLPSGGGVCLVVTRGRLGSPDADRPQSQGEVTATAMNGVGLAGTPDFYMEARLVVRPRPGATPPVNDLVLQPQYLQFARTAARRGRDEEKTLGMVLILRQDPLPGAATSTTAATGANAVFPLNFGTLRPGTEIVPASYTPVGSDMAPTHPLADLERSTPLGSGVARVNAYAFVTETAEPERVLTLLNAALERGDESLQAALTKAIQDAIKAAGAPPAAGAR